MHNIYFTPGPSALYYTAEGHLKNALTQQLGSISHRSKAFEAIYSETQQNLRELLSIPDDFEIFFTSSANEIWERLIQNCVENTSYHLVNGAFSKKFYEISGELGKKAILAEASEGNCVAPENVSIPSEVELIAATQNETSTGAAHSLANIYALKAKNPDALLTVDVVSAVPYINLDFTQIDSAYFSVQKGFGLPAGLGVWVLNQRCIEKSKYLKEKGKSTGSYHSISSFLSKGTKNQTPETPNVLGIYLLGKVAGDMINKGIQQIRRETEYKSALLYHMMESHPLFSPFVKNSNEQSKTVIVIETEKVSNEVIADAAQKRMIIGSGYGGYKNQHLRIANFPTHSKEQFEMLVDYLNDYH